MIVRASFAVILLALLALAGCGEDEQTATITVIAATSLKDSFTAIAASYEAANPGTTVKASFVPSDKIGPQIEAGFDADVIATASGKHMKALVDGGTAEDPVPFAGNDLVIGVAEKSSDKISEAQDLAGNIRLSVGDEGVPIGDYTMESIATMSERWGADYGKAVEANIANRGQSAADVLAPVTLGGVDASISYSSDVAAADGVKRVEFPAWAKPNISYWISASPEGQDFVDAVVAEGGQAELTKAGFAAPPKDAEL